MKNPVLTTLRWMDLRRNVSTLSTGLLPLKKVHSAVVFVDAVEQGDDAERVSRAVRQFFEYQGIPVTILSPVKKDLNMIGRLKPRVRGRHRNPRREDLFISLAATPESFAAEFEARCSRARFKVGRFQLPEKVFDLVVAAPGGVDATQSAAFSAIKDYLSKIR